MIRHEDTLLSSRITWFCTLQGLLMASLTFALSKSSALLVPLVAGVGFVVSVSTLYMASFTAEAVQDLLKWWERTYGAVDGEPPIIGKTGSKPFLRPWIVLPSTFIAAWLIVLFYWFLARPLIVG
jgi:hypothetical protein